MNFQIFNTRYIRIICLNNNQVDWAGLWEARIFGPENVTPVELSSFTAIANDEGNVVLNWTTSTETNNKSFIVERKKDFEELFSNCYYSGSGTNTIPTSYTYTDSSVESGVYTYRLKQVDFNGHISYSNSVSVNVNVVSSFKLEQNYPNPFNPSTKINFTCTKRKFCNT